MYWNTLLRCSVVIFSFLVKLNNADLTSWLKPNSVLTKLQSIPLPKGLNKDLKI